MYFHENSLSPFYYLTFVHVKADFKSPTESLAFATHYKSQSVFINCHNITNTMTTVNIMSLSLVMMGCLIFSPIHSSPSVGIIMYALYHISKNPGVHLPLLPLCHVLRVSGPV